MSKMFVHFNGTKEAFIQAGHPSVYTNHIVFIKGDTSGNGSCVFTHGEYYGNIKEALSALKFAKGISVGGESYDFAAGGGYLGFSAADPSTVAVNASKNGVTIGLTDAFVQKVNGNASDVNELANVTIPALQEELEGSIKDNADAIDALEERMGTAEGNIDSINKEVAAHDLTIGVLVGKDGDLSDLITTAKDNLVAAINEVAGNVTNNSAAAAVTVDKSTDGLTYTIKQGGTTKGTINIPKDMVVSSGKYEDGNLILTIANGGGDVTIPVSELIDVYTGSQSDTIGVSVNDDNSISAYLMPASVATEHLDSDAVTDAKIAANAVVTAKIKDANVTKAKLESSVQTSLGKADTAYQKPSTGIPSSDLAAAVQTSLGKADAAAPQATTYTKTEVDAMWAWEELN